jgi:predicted secreted Zn-dependent protease
MVHRSLMYCSILSLALLSACATTKLAVPLRPDIEHPDRFICEAAGARPNIPPEYVIDWSAVHNVPQAKAEHDKFVATIRSRENVIGGYIVAVEGNLFVCSNNMQWLRDFYAGLPKDIP